MAKKKPTWISFKAERFVHDALAAHQRRLERERPGQRVTVSDAARDAILRTGKEPS